MSIHRDLFTSTTLNRSELRRWLIALCAGAGMCLGAMDTAVNVALPAMTRDLHTDMQTIQWIIVAHVAARAGLAVGAGSTGDLFGLRRVFLAGVLCYTVTIAAISFTPQLYAIFGLRAVQGIGTGTMMALAPAVAGRAFSRQHRGRVMGVAFASQALGIIAATLGAAVIIEVFGWRSIFMARIPLGVATFLLAWLLLDRDRPDTGGRSFDLLGVLALSGALVTLVVGLHVGGRDGWTSPVAMAMLAMCPLLAATVWRVERRASWPVLDVALFRVQAFLATFMATLLAWTGVFVIWFIFPFYISDVLNRGAGSLGVMLAVMATTMLMVSLAGGWLADRFNARRVGVVGLASMATGLVWTSYVGETTSLVQVGLRISLVGVGLGLTQTAVYTLMITGVPRERAGTASGALGVAESVGRVMSVAVFGALFAIRQDHHQGLLSPGAPLVPGEESAAFVAAFHEVLLVAAGVTLASMIALILLARERRRPVLPAPVAPC